MTGRRGLEGGEVFFLAGLDFFIIASLRSQRNGPQREVRRTFKVQCTSLLLTSLSFLHVQVEIASIHFKTAGHRWAWEHHYFELRERQIFE